MEVTKKIPSLRFPGFEGVWEEKKLGEVGESIIGLTYSADDVSPEGILVLRSSNIKDSKLSYSDNVYVKKDIPQKLITKEGDVLICTNNGSKNLIGKSALIDAESEGYSFGGFMTIFRSENGKFVFQLLQTELFRKEIYKNLGSIINRISIEDLNNMKFNFPSFPEQQKIADCLTAMDDTIEAQQQKVEQLQAYKKGLLQQLFSQTLRFPEFEGEWEEKKLGEISEIYQPKTISQSEFTTCGFPVYGANGVIGCYSSFNHETEQIAIGCRGNCGAINLTQKKSWITGNAMVINVDKFKETINKYFLNHLLQNNNLNYMVSGSGQPQITRGDFVRHKIKIPKLIEQQKIADCLSTLDEVIELEQQKFEKLQVYKKGLLQQLFV